MVHWLFEIWNNSMILESAKRKICHQNSASKQLKDSVKLPRKLILFFRKQSLIRNEIDSFPNERSYEQNQTLQCYWNRPSSDF